MAVDSSTIDSEFLGQLSASAESNLGPTAFTPAPSLDRDGGVTDSKSKSRQRRNHCQ